jgi:uncharacterized membrane protein (DUF485 family)
MALFEPRRGSASRTAAPQVSNAARPVSSTPAPQVSDPKTSDQRTSDQRTSGPQASSTPVPQAGRGTASGYEAVRASRDFWTIRRRFGSFVGPACVLFIGWYFLFVILSVFAPGFMRISVFGSLKLGLCFGLLQFVSTFAIAATYRRWARRRLDPLADRLRRRLEGGREQ